METNAEGSTDVLTLHAHTVHTVIRGDVKVVVPVCCSVAVAEEIACLVAERLSSCDTDEQRANDAESIESIESARVTCDGMGYGRAALRSGRVQPRRGRLSAVAW